MLRVFLVVLIDLITAISYADFCDKYCFKVVSPTKNTSHEIRTKINDLLSEDEIYWIDEYEENNVLQVDLFLSSNIKNNYKNKRKLLNQTYPNIRFVLFKYAHGEQGLSLKELKSCNYILIKACDYKNNLDMLLKDISDNNLLLLGKKFYNNKDNIWLILVGIDCFNSCDKEYLNADEMIEDEYLYCVNIICTVFEYNHTIKEGNDSSIYTYWGEFAINYFNKNVIDLSENKSIKNENEITVKNRIKNFGINRNLINKVFLEQKEISVSYVRALRDYLIKECKLDLKNCLNGFLKDIFDNLKSMYYEDLEVSLNVFHEILCCSQFLSNKWNRIFLVSAQRNFYSFNPNYIEKLLIEKLKIPVRLSFSLKSCEFELHEKNLIILLSKTKNFHKAPLMRIVNNNKIYWILMETIAESYLWFTSSNFEEFYDSLQKVVKDDQEKNPAKEVKGYLNRVKLQHSNCLCEVFAYANSLAVFENLEEFTNFLDHYKPQPRKDIRSEFHYLPDSFVFPEKEDIIELNYLPHFIIKFCQSISNLDAVTYNQESKKALESMILLDNNSTKSKKINSTILSCTYELFAGVIDEIELTFSNDYETDAMLYYESENQTFY